MLCNWFCYTEQNECPSQKVEDRKTGYLSYLSDPSLPTLPVTGVCLLSLWQSWEVQSLFSKLLPEQFV